MTSVTRLTPLLAAVPSSGRPRSLREFCDRAFRDFRSPAAVNDGQARGLETELSPLKTAGIRPPAADSRRDQIHLLNISSRPSTAQPPLDSADT